MVWVTEVLIFFFIIFFRKWAPHCLEIPYKRRHARWAHHSSGAVWRFRSIGPSRIILSFLNLNYNDIGPLEFFLRCGHADFEHLLIVESTYVTLVHGLQDSEIKILFPVKLKSCIPAIFSIKKCNVEIFQEFKRNSSSAVISCWWKTSIEWQPYYPIYFGELTFFNRIFICDFLCDYA